MNATQPGSRGAEVLAAASAALAATSAALRADRELFESSARFRTLHDLGEWLSKRWSKGGVAPCRFYSNTALEFGPSIQPARPRQQVACLGPGQCQALSLAVVKLRSPSVLSPAAALSEAASLYLDAQAMLPQPNQAFIELDTLTAAAGGPAAGLVGVEVFGSSSVLDDMAHAAVWLAVATGGWRQSIVVRK